ncbi:MAG: hypothetical protein GX104_02950 [Spirochaetales bacterium]|nr:hypothetical protein [Spirochaetales bacterium]
MMIDDMWATPQDGHDTHEGSIFRSSDTFAFEDPRRTKTNVLVVETDEKSLKV